MAVVGADSMRASRRAECWASQWAILVTSEPTVTSPFARARREGAGRRCPERVERLPCAASAWPLILPGSCYRNCVRQRFLAALLFASGVGVASLGCRHEQAAVPPPSAATVSAPLPSVTPNPAPPPASPVEVSEKIRRIDSQHFELDRPLLALLARAALGWHREHLNGQVVFKLYGQTLKLSPERVGDHWEGVRAYLDLDARIARNELVAQHILSALGTRAEDHPGATPMDKAIHAIDEQLARVKADQERKTEPLVVPSEIRLRLAAVQKALWIRGSLKTWRPAVDGTLPALLGFEELDVIEEVNGAPVKSFGEIFDALSKLGTRANQIELELERNGEPVQLTYRIVD
jgi:hypothetical protein